MRLTSSRSTTLRWWIESTESSESYRCSTENSGLCLQAHDLAASKLYAYREKDRDFVRTLLVERLIDPTLLRDRIDVLPADGDRKERMEEWVRITAEEL